MKNQSFLPKRPVLITHKEEDLLTYLGKVWKYRSLAFALARRDLRVQYAQTLLGVLWSVIQPLTGLLIFTVFFTRLMQVDTGSLPYHIFAFSGIVVWFFFTFLVGHVGTALRGGQDLIKKVYFPKLTLIVSKVLVGSVEFSISFILLVLMILLEGNLPSWRIILLPLFLLALVLTGLSVGLWLSALTVRYRDFHHIIPYIVNFGIWLAPVFYPATILPADYYFLIFLNPVAGLIETFRWIVLAEETPSLYYFISYVPVLILFATGLLYFRKIERDIADYV